MNISQLPNLTKNSSHFWDFLHPIIASRLNESPRWSAEKSWNSGILLFSLGSTPLWVLQAWRRTQRHQFPSVRSKLHTLFNKNFFAQPEKYSHESIVLNNKSNCFSSWNFSLIEFLQKKRRMNLNLLYHWYDL